MSSAEPTAAIFAEYRGLLFGIAYRMLGSASDAEDIVQEAFVRWLQAGEPDVRSPRAYLATVVVRLCLDHLRLARTQREVYVGPWLPEPIATSQRPELTETAILAESLSYAFMVMLESLQPLERAVFLLREVFDYAYPEIAEIVGKSEANCRQILHRARARLGRRESRYDVSREQQERITAQFLRASTGGDMAGLLNLLTDDIVYTGDGGGKAVTGLKPVRGRDKVARGMFGGIRRLAPATQGRMVEINGQPGIIAYLDDQPVAAMILDLAGDQVRHVYAVLNPDKLSWLGSPNP